MPPPTEIQIEDFFKEVLLITEDDTVLALFEQGLKSMAAFNGLKL